MAVNPSKEQMRVCPLQTYSRNTAGYFVLKDDVSTKWKQKSVERAGNSVACVEEPLRHSSSQKQSYSVVRQQLRCCVSSGVLPSICPQLSVLLFDLKLRTES